MFSTRRYPADVPEYAAIVRGCSQIDRSASLWTLCGYLFAVFTLLCGFILFATISGSRVRGLDRIGADDTMFIGKWTLGFLVATSASFGRATHLRMRAAMGLALRDIARNSFLLPEPPRVQPPAERSETY